MTFEEVDRNAYGRYARLLHGPEVTKPIFGANHKLLPLFPR
ncbi:hypothetical protein VCR14J2_260141 [Vibrio coralliirubri]|nr:hypothetical protein VCR14J2_260141 [Vibrio coralliirubri]